MAGPPNNKKRFRSKNRRFQAKTDQKAVFNSYIILLYEVKLIRIFAALLALFLAWPGLALATEPDVYTHTLQSGLMLTFPIEITFGDIIVSGLLLLLLAVLVFDFLFRLVYRR